MERGRGPGRWESALDQWEDPGAIDWIWLVWATVLFRGEVQEEEAAASFGQEGGAGGEQRSSEGVW